MPIPGVSISVEDGGLGIASPSVGQSTITFGIADKATANTLYGGYSQGNLATIVSDLGYGPGVEALALKVASGGGPHYFMQLTPAFDSAASSVTKTGTGSGTLTVAAGVREQITVLCAATGDLGVATFQFKKGTGSYSAPVTSAAGWSTGYQVSGTLTKLSFVKGAGPTYYEAGDVFTVSTTLAPSTNATVTRTGSSTGHVQQASQYLDDFTVRVEVTTAGARGAGQYRYTLDYFVDDSGNFIGSWSPTLIIPSAGAYAIPNTGVVITFSNHTHDDDNLYEFTTIATGASGSDVTAAYTALQALSTSLSIAGSHVALQSTSAANAATLATTVDTALAAMFTAKRFMYGIVDVPTNNSRILSGGVPTAFSRTDAQVATDFASTTSLRVAAGAGDALTVSPLSGRLCRRACSWHAAARAGAVSEQVNLHRVKSGPLSFVRSIYRDESTSEVLDAARLLTLRTHVQKSGYYVTKGRTLADSTSDYSSLANRRVMDTACREVLSQASDLIGDTVVTNSNGTIKESEAQAIEKELTSGVTNVLRDGSVQKVSAVSVTVDRNENINSTETLPISVAIRPLGSLNNISVTIGYAVEAA